MKYHSCHFVSFKAKGSNYQSFVYTVRSFCLEADDLFVCDEIYNRNFSSPAARSSKQPNLSLQTRSSASLCDVQRRDAELGPADLHVLWRHFRFGGWDDQTTRHTSGSYLHKKLEYSICSPALCLGFSKPQNYTCRKSYLCWWLWFWLALCVSCLYRNIYVLDTYWGHPWYSGSTIDPAPGAWCIAKFISLISPGGLRPNIA